MRLSDCVSLQFVPKDELEKYRKLFESYCVEALARVTSLDKKDCIEILLTDIDERDRWKYELMGLLKAKKIDVEGSIISALIREVRTMIFSGESRELQSIVKRYEREVIEEALQEVPDEANKLLSVLDDDPWNESFSCFEDRLTVERIARAFISSITRKLEWFSVSPEESSALENLYSYIPHGITHLQRVERNLVELTRCIPLSPIERFVLWLSTVAHAAGISIEEMELARDRMFSKPGKKRPVISAEIAWNELLNPYIVDVLGADIPWAIYRVIAWHTIPPKMGIKKKADIPDASCDTTLNPTLLAGLLRIADLLDCDERGLPPQETMKEAWRLVITGDERFREILNLYLRRWLVPAEEVSGVKGVEIRNDGNVIRIILTTRNYREAFWPARNPKKLLVSGEEAFKGLLEEFMMELGLPENYAKIKELLGKREWQALLERTINSIRKKLELEFGNPLFPYLNEERRQFLEDLGKAKTVEDLECLINRWAFGTRALRPRRVMWVIRIHGEGGSPIGWNELIEHLREYLYIGERWWRIMKEARVLLKNVELLDISSMDDALSEMEEILGNKGSPAPITLQTRKIPRGAIKLASLLVNHGVMARKQLVDILLKMPKDEIPELLGDVDAPLGKEVERVVHVLEGLPPEERAKGLIECVRLGWNGGQQLLELKDVVSTGTWAHVLEMIARKDSSLREEAIMESRKLDSIYHANVLKAAIEADKSMAEKVIEESHYLNLRDRVEVLGKVIKIAPFLEEKIRFELKRIIEESRGLNIFDRLYVLVIVAWIDPILRKMIRPDVEKIIKETRELPERGRFYLKMAALAVPSIANAIIQESQTLPMDDRVHVLRAIVMADPSMAERVRPELEKIIEETRNLYWKRRIYVLRAIVMADPSMAERVRPELEKIIEETRNLNSKERKEVLEKTVKMIPAMAEKVIKESRWLPEWDRADVLYAVIKADPSMAERVRSELEEIIEESHGLRGSERVDVLWKIVKIDPSMAERVRSELEEIIEESHGLRGSERVDVLWKIVKIDPSMAERVRSELEEIIKKT